MNIRLAKPSEKTAWDTYIHSHEHSTHCHLFGWKDVIYNTYRHKGYYLLAEEDSKIVGVLPLIHMKSLLFGNQLVSMPFLNYGGILADSENVADKLIKEAMKIGARLKASIIELRHFKPIGMIPSLEGHRVQERTHKVRMVLNLPASKGELFNTFKSKLRSQILRPIKEGMKAVIGGEELLDSFFGIFSTNMRDLGSPVHSKKLFREIYREFSDSTIIGVVNYDDTPVAAGLIFCFRDMVEIPWASSLREFNKFSPNMLLYWTLIEYGCDQGFKDFDFGRSTPNEGTYRFKEQWGAKPELLHWHFLTSNGKPIGIYPSDRLRFDNVVQVWKRLPLIIAGMIGPIVRKHISL